MKPPGWRTWQSTLQRAIAVFGHEQAGVPPEAVDLLHVAVEVPMIGTANAHITRGMSQRGRGGGGGRCDGYKQLVPPRVQVSVRSNMTRAHLAAAVEGGVSLRPSLWALRFDDHPDARNRQLAGIQDDKRVYTDGDET